MTDMELLTSILEGNEPMQCVILYDHRNHEKVRTWVFYNHFEESLNRTLKARNWTEQYSIVEVFKPI